MAAGQVVCPFFGVVFARLTSLIDNDWKRLRPLVGMVKDQLKKLNKNFCRIKDVLDDYDAEERQFDEAAVRLWLEELNDSSYKADDVFDECDYYGGLQQQPAEEASSSSNNKKVTEQQLYEKLQKLIEMSQASIEECSGLSLQKRKGKSVVVSPDRRTDSFLTEPKVYGRDDDRDKLVMRLLGSVIKFTWAKHPTTVAAPKHASSSSSQEDNLSVFPIVGMGGLGKTTFAQMVYNDDRVKTHFNFKFWVYVSNDFDVERIMKDIVGSLPRSTGVSEDLEKLGEHFHNELRNKIFLLVLDDVWEESQVKWNKLKGLLRGGAQGSSIILTTRLEKVACIAGTRSFHCLKGLSENESWNLFKQYAFGRGNKEKPTLEKIGKEIVKKCKGLPLSTKTMGGLLRFKTKEEEWIAVKESEIWELPQSNDNDILPALRLSYHNLPSDLKQCFVYCSIFSKDYKIEIVKLIQLWIANGFVQTRARMELEDVGNEIFNELLWRSFFQDVEKDENDNIIRCKMHDLLQDLASYIAGNESQVILDGESARATTERTRHVSVLSSPEVLPSSILEDIKSSTPCLRSLVDLDVYGWYRQALNSEILVSDFNRLRALDLYTLGIKVELPVLDGIGDMIHLRYLDLSSSCYTLLPDSICLLRNLQTLKLKKCYYLESLPTDVRKMTNLRCLDIQGCYRLTSMPIGIGQLTSLRTLSIFIVGMESGRSLSELQGLNLGGELEIKGLQHVKTTMEARAANLGSKKNLCSLSFEWPWLEQRREQNAKEEEKEEKKEESYSETELQQHQDVIEGLQPHTNLRVLKVTEYRGVAFSPSWLTPSCVPNLVKISLSYCRRCERLSPLGKLGSLKALDLAHMDSLKFIVMDDDDDDARTFRSLEELCLQDMPDLEGWSSPSLQSSLSSQTAIAPVFPRLKKVWVSRCPKLEGEVPLSGSPVEHVSIHGSSNGMVLDSLHDLHYLPSFQIDEHAEMESLPPGALRNLTALQQLRITYCHSLKTLPVQLKSLTTLTKLTIQNCRNLVSLAEGEGGLRNLSSLRTLDLCDCDALKRLPELDKTSVVSLAIIDCPQMEFSSDDFEHLVVLEMLTLCRLPKLSFFPEGIKHNAAKLQHLQFENCSENGAVDLPDWISTLTSLRFLSISAPKNWKVLPQWLQHFTALDILLVYGCDQELERRWKNKDKQREEDYSFNMISHVPIVRFGKSQPTSWN